MSLSSSSVAGYRTFNPDNTGSVEIFTIGISLGGGSASDDHDGPR